VNLHLLLALSVGATYLLGSVPFGLLLSRAVAGVDVRGVGSGNIGATNVVRAAGKLTGVATLTLDLAKSALPVFLMLWFARATGLADADWWTIGVGLAAFAGHLFPVWIGFKGGKGVATGLGIFVVLSPWSALAGVVGFIVSYASTRLVSLSSLVGTVLCAGGAIVRYGPANPISWGAAIVGFGIFARHRSNIVRLLRGTEKRV
jgi:glycerol-3-phosphate acyltransferase PlsY